MEFARGPRTHTPTVEARPHQARLTESLEHAREHVSLGQSATVNRKVPRVKLRFLVAVWRRCQRDEHAQAHAGPRGREERSRRDGVVEMACAKCLKSPLLLLLPVLEGGTSSDDGSSGLRRSSKGCTAEPRLHKARYKPRQAIAVITAIETVPFRNQGLDGSICS